MRKLLIAAVMALSLAMPGIAAANEPVCETAGWGWRSAQIERGSEVWTYVARIAGPQWVSAPFGWHAPARLECNFCTRRASGLAYFFGAIPANTTAAFLGLDASVDWSVHPENSAARIARDAEQISYPIRVVHGDDLTSVAHRDDISVGRMTGYAVEYEMIVRDRNRQNGTQKSTEYSLLVLSLGDGCAQFDTALVMQAHVEAEPLSMLDSLLSELSFERLGGAVRPVRTEYERTSLLKRQLLHRAYIFYRKIVCLREAKLTLFAKGRIGIPKLTLNATCPYRG